MTETQNKHPIMTLAKLMPRINYAKIRGYFQLLTAFFIIVAAASLAGHGNMLHTIAYGLLASVMFNCANRCESIILKQKIERWLQHNAPVISGLESKVDSME